MKNILFCLLILFLLSGCNVQKNQISSDSISNQQEESLPSSSANDEYSDTECTPVNNETPSNLATPPDEQKRQLTHSKSYEESLNRFITFLEQGKITDNYDYIGLDYYYENSFFFNLPVKVIDIQEIATAQAVIRGGNYQTYLFTIDIPTHDNETPLVSGQQEWILILADYDYLDLYFGIERFCHRAKYESWLKTNEDDSIALLMDTIQMGVGYNLFDTPKDIPVNRRGSYLLTNVSTNGTMGLVNGTMSLEEADAMAEKYFGEKLDRDFKYAFCEDLENSGMLRFEGMSSPVYSNNFFMREVDAGNSYYYYERFGNEQEQLCKLPEMIIRYTIRDGIVYSAEDVTEQFILSPYLESMIAK